MQFIFFDTETSSTNPTFGQMLEFSAIACDENLTKTGQSLTLQSRLRPHIIPDLGALLVTNKTIEDINSRPLSHYNMIMEILKASRSWTPSTWIGWNTIEFDFKWLRQAFYQCLQQPYFHQFYGNRRADSLPIARTSHLLKRGAIKVNLGKKGRPSFKLEELAKANSIDHNDAHTALSDVHATIEVTKLVANNCPDIWEKSLLTSSKEDTENIVWKEPVFIMTESIFGLTSAKIMTALIRHPVYNWTIAIDLQVDPKKYLALGIQELSKFLEKTPKPLRTIRTSNHPIILDLNYKDRVNGYNSLSLDTINERASLLQKDIHFKEKLTKILLEKYEAKNMNIPDRRQEPEELIHKGYLVPIGEEETLLKIFEEQSNWDDRYHLSKNFKDRRLYELAMRLIFEESPKSLPQDIYQQKLLAIRSRLFTDGDVPWTTVKKAIKAIKELEDKEKNSREKEILESYKNFIETLSAKLG